MPASTVYPGNCKGRCVTWEGGQERLQHLVGLHSPQVTFVLDERDNVYSL